LASDAKRATAAETASLVTGDAPKVKLGATHGHTNTEPADPRSEGGERRRRSTPPPTGPRKPRRRGAGRWALPKWIPVTRAGKKSTASRDCRAQRRGARYRRRGEEG
jgi:hypothetical protein